MRTTAPSNATKEEQVKLGKHEVTVQHRFPEETDPEKERELADRIYRIFSKYTS